MKKIKIFIAILIASFNLTSCEEVVDIDLDTAAPKLVIDASIQWEKGTTGENQTIKLTNTTDFYSNTIPVASGAFVNVTNTSLATPAVYSFLENGQTGEYVCKNFIPVIGNKYKLTIIYKDQTYNATSTFLASPKIIKKEQIIRPGFDGKDTYQIKFYFQDNGDENNFYLAGIKNPTIAYPQYSALTDKFFQGNLMFSIYQNKDLKKGDVLPLSLQAMDENYFNYMSKLLKTAGSGRGNPFATAPSTLRGNIINQTNQEDYPYGYFQLSEVDNESYTIE